MKYNKNTVIAEVAGRDSIASIIKYAKDNPGSYILPTIVITPPEEKRQVDISRYMNSLQHYIFKLGSFMYAPIFLDVDVNWWSMNKMVDSTQKEYGFYTYCIPCHGLVHAVRIPLARILGGKIITGERLLHENRKKINQEKIVINAYDKIFSKNGIKVIRPFLHTDKNTEIDILVDEFESSYHGGKFRHIGCSLSGNIDKDSVDMNQLRRYCAEKIIPDMNRIIKELEENEWGLRMLG